VSGAGGLARSAPAVAARRWWAILAHRGERVSCPVCGWSFDRFKDDWNRPEALCWRCGAHERHRMLALVLERRPELLAGAGSLLHLAPEWGLRRRLSTRTGLRYVTADLYMDGVDERLDVRALALPDASFGAVICSHVLEHVDEDRAAMRELARVLAPGGWLLVMVPLDLGRERTYEDDCIRTPAARERAFLQRDHLRLYAPDVADRLAEAGLEVEVVRPRRELGAEAMARYGLIESDYVFLCRRPAP
jgi:SAM-dependent methyltransferase